MKQNDCPIPAAIKKGSRRKIINLLRSLYFLPCLFFYHLWLIRVVCGCFPLSHDYRFDQRSLVPSTKEVPDCSISQGHFRAKGTRNIQGNEPGHHLLLNLCAYNTWLLRIEVDLSVLMGELSHIRRDIVGLVRLRYLVMSNKHLREDMPFTGQMNLRAGYMNMEYVLFILRNVLKWIWASSLASISLVPLTFKFN